jgi:hypothetical protein
MKRLSVLVFACIACCSLYGQNDSAYNYTYGGIQDDVCSQIKATYDGGYIMIGTTNSFGCGYTDFYAVKVDSLGRHQWSRTYGGSQIQEGFSVAPTSDHGYVFVGFTDSYGAGGYDVFMVKVDSTGKEEWERTYGGSNWDFGYSVQQLPDKGFVICGLTYSFGAGNGDVYIIRTDSNGAAIWTQTAGGANYGIGNSITVVNDSLYAIVGNTTSMGLGDTNAYFIMVDGKGNIVKDTTYGSTHSNIGNSINKTIDHGFIIFGATDSIQPGKPDEMLIKTDSIGDLQWMQVYHSGGNSVGHDVIEASDGSYLAVSTSNSYGWGGYAMRVWHINAGGTPLCGPSFGGAEDEQGVSVAIAKNGSVAFAGSTNSEGYTEGLNDAYMVRMQNDSVINIVNFFTLPYYEYKDTCLCIINSVFPVAFHPGVNIFPNPVRSSATILVQGELNVHYTYSLYNIAGESIIKGVPLKSIAHGQYVSYFERGSLAVGMYVYEIYNQAGAIVSTGKIIVE